jgi:hypothetical protein
MLKPKRLGAYLLTFVGWSLVFSIVYYFAADVYAVLVVSLGEWMTNLLVPINLETASRGFVLTTPEAREPMGVPYSLSLIGLNSIFAPALVMTTVGVNFGGVLRAGLSLVIMAALHAMEVMSIVLFHISHPENTAIALGYSDAMVSLIQWFYRFIDRMSYALFPFLAWALACPDVIADLFRSRDNGTVSGTADGPIV